MFFPLFILSLGVLFFYFFSFSIKIHFKSKKIHPIYGPSSYPIIGCLISFYKNRNQLLNWYTNLLSKSPTQTILIHRIGAPRTIITANASNVEHILKTNFTNYPKGKPFNEILGDFLGVGIFNVDGELWNRQRKLASHEFSTNSLREFVVKTLEEEVVTRLIPLLENAAESYKVLDLQDVLRRFAFDTICKVSLGIDLHFLDFESNSHVPCLAEAFDNASHACAMRGMSPIYLVWKLKKVLNIGSERKLKENVNLVRDCINEIIVTKKQKIHENVSHDLLSRLLMMDLEDDVVRDMVISFLMAGRDTTSSALTWLFWLLTNNRDIEKEILREITSLKNDNDNVDIDYDQLKEMKYAHACLCESMRLYPPVAWDSKHAEKDDYLPDGSCVYKGDRVTYFQYGMGRMEEIWGKDRLEFKPKRWFDDENGELKMESLYKFPVFQAGPRICLGKEMAFIQMKYVLASVLNRFEIRPVSLENPVFVPLLTAYMDGGFNVRICNRGSG